MLLSVNEKKDPTTLTKKKKFFKEDLIYNKDETICHHCNITLTTVVKKTKKIVLSCVFCPKNLKLPIGLTKLCKIC